MKHDKIVMDTNQIVKLRLLNAQDRSLRKGQAFLQSARIAS